MHNNEFLHILPRFLHSLCSFMSVIFWLLLIYGFDEPCEAGITVLCALIHELGHFTYIVCLRGDTARLGSVVNGFRIRRARSVSYRDELAAYASGPIANLAAMLITLPFLANGYASLFAAINVITAVSNLLPIRGYDGYGIARAFFQSKEWSATVLDGISFALETAICLFSLYAMEKVGEGYWIFGIFFFSLISDMLRAPFLKK